MDKQAQRIKLTGGPRRCSPTRSRVPARPVQRRVGRQTPQHVQNPNRGRNDHSPTAVALSSLSTSFDHAIHLHHERFREREAGRPGGLHVHDQLELGRLLDWDFAWICALENLVDVDGRAAKIVGE